MRSPADLVADGLAPRHVETVGMFVRLCPPGYFVLVHPLAGVFAIEHLPVAELLGAERKAATEAWEVIKASGKQLAPVVVLPGGALEVFGNQ